MTSRPLMISLLDKDDTELLELVSHTFKEGLGNNVTMPGVPSLRSKMLNLIEVSLTCYNNHKEHEQHYQEQQREAHRHFQSRIASPVPSRNVIHNSVSASLSASSSASSSSTSSRKEKGNRNVTRNVTRNGNHSDTARTSSSVESMNRNSSDSSNGTTDVTTIASPLPSENVNLSSPSMEERRTRRAVSMDETEVSPTTNNREERVNRRRATSMDETTSPTRKRQKTTPSKRGRPLLISPQKEVFSVDDSVFSCWWSNGAHQSQGYFSCKITKVHGNGKKYDILYDVDGKKGQRAPRAFVKRTKP